jgi:hypothetical protein
MIVNVIDKRTNCYKWKQVDACVEPTWHDNSVGADQAVKGSAEQEGIGYEEIQLVSVHRAFEWANGFPYASTVYLYDPGTFQREQKPTHK